MFEWGSVGLSSWAHFILNYESKYGATANCRIDPGTRIQLFREADRTAQLMANDASCFFLPVVIVSLEYQTPIDRLRYSFALIPMSTCTRFSQIRILTKSMNNCTSSHLIHNIKPIATTDRRSTAHIKFIVHFHLQGHLRAK